ncbi:Two component regulator propeller [Dyadobacter soli]|uniref:Two component regulator propeller n=1 Tax=Dyadobacter soli TaxID=659014 RepID=A0A1G6XWC8_9BACT|nr:histidine kinase [Dyadobacter soli]SDD81715.1 Two component regulator propeller [Dyadobacter soli]
MWLRLALWLLLFAISALRVEAQFIFQNLNEDDGLLTKFSRCLYKDRNGFLWIGTADGLYRFDGNFVKRYTGIKNERIVATAIQPIDNGARLLIGTPDGIRIFDSGSSSFKTDPRFTAVSREAIVGIKKDGYKRLWILCDKKIFLFQDNAVTSIEQILPGAGRLSDFEPSLYNGGTFAWDSLRNGFWVGGKQCFFIDCRKNMIYDSTNCPFYAPLLKKSNVTAIALNSRHNIWYSSHTDFPIGYIDFQQKQITGYREVQGKKIETASNLIFIDKQDRIWTSHLNYAEYFKEPNKPIIPIPYSQDAPYSIAYRRFYDAMEDSEGNLWFATLNGVSKLQFNSPFRNIYRLPNFPFFLETGFAQAGHISVSDSIIFASKLDGLIRLEKGRPGFQRHTVSQDSLIKNFFLMTAKVGQNWWACATSGVFFLRNGGPRIEQVKEIRRSIRGEKTNLIFADRKGRIWFHVENDGIYRFDPKTRQCQRFDGTDPKSGLFKYTHVSSFVQLATGDIIFSMIGVGLLRFALDSERFSSISVRNPGKFVPGKIIEDKSGNIWISILDQGVYKMGLNGKVLDSLNHNLDFSFAYSVSLALDSRGALWGGSANGLFYTFPGSREVIRVKINLGKTLQDYWFHVSTYKGMVYAVMLDHIVEIDPSKFSSIPVKHAPLITSFRVFGKEVSDFLHSGIELEPDQDFVTFQYASLYHRDIPSLQYSYQLEGIDKNWVNAGRNLSVSYNSLGHGDYVFKVRSTGQDGKWMKQITTIPIRVLPNWWQTWWFFVLVGVLTCTFIDLAYTGYLGRKHKAQNVKAIEYFLNSVYGDNSVTEICWDIARNCTSQLHFEDCTVFLWDESKQKLVQKAAHSSVNNSESEIVDPLEIELGKGIVGIAGSCKKTIIVPDTTVDKDYVRHDASKLSEIAVPILHEGKLIGVLDSEHSKKDFFTNDQVHTLVTIASINANKIAEAQAEEASAQKEIMLLEINRMLAESQLMALRAQMNPHFVFNCLNSIQECIVTQKYREASKYLNKFSKLFRMVLNNSDRNLVTIEEEKNVLELYLELEQMRFEQSFVYRIDIDDELEADDILLPSMLLQPYVENAIWHGLMHKDGYRELKISFDRIDEEIFQCKIDDNGVGRQKSFEIRERNATTRPHKSKGLQIAKDRLTLIDRQGQHASVEIVDKYDSNDIATGTMIVIELSTSLENT